MNVPTRINSAIIRADFPQIIKRVRDGEIIIILRNNHEECALVPLEFLIKKEGTKKSKVA